MIWQYIYIKLTRIVMKITAHMILSLLLVVAFGCSEKEDGEEEANYRVTFSFHWNSQDFPVDYPSNAHFSKLIGWSHKSSTNFFMEGTLASDGIENMAETGGTSPLDNEITSRIADGEGLELVIGDLLASGTGEIVVEINVDREHPCVTLATMIAPSPDWYVAVVNVNLYDDSRFSDEKIVNAIAFDAGTDNGSTFTSDDLDADPQQPIALIKDPPLGNGSTVSPIIATVTFTKL